MPGMKCYITDNNSYLTYGSSYLYISDNNEVTFGDGIIYHTVTIGTQTWITTNFMMDIPTYSKLVSPEDATNGIGRMYQQAAVSAISEAIAPYGWRVASISDFSALAAFVVNDGKNMPLSIKSVSWDGTDDYGLGIVKSHSVSAGAGLTETNYWTTDTYQRFYLRESTEYGYDQREASEWNNIRILKDN